MSYIRHKQSLFWFSRQTYINEKFDSVTLKFIPRGTVAFALMGENIGHEKNEIRPVLVISNDQMNKFSSNVIIATLTKAANKTDPSGKIKLLPSQYILYKSDAPFLTYDSIIQFEDIRSISKARLLNILGIVDKKNLAAMKSRIKTIFEI